MGKITMDGDLLAAILGLAGFLLGVSFQWGAQKAAISRMQTEIEAIKAMFNSLYREYVPFKHFDAVISEMKDSMRDINSEIKTIQSDLKEILRHVKE